MTKKEILTNESGKPLLGRKDDFRERSAKRRREKMRARLIDGTSSACDEYGARNVSLQDVLNAADVSRGTFYKHFDSVHDAIVIVAQRIADEAQAENLTLYEGVEDVLLRNAAGPILNLTRAALQPGWAHVIVEGGELGIRSIFVRAIRSEILAGMRGRIFNRTDVQAAVDLHVGAMIQGARTLLQRNHKQGTYIRNIDLNLLMAFGVPRSIALDAVKRATDDLNERAPSVLKWWKELE